MTADVSGLCGYTMARLELVRERRPALLWWARTKAHLLDRPTGAADFAAYTETATKITRKLDALPAEARTQVLSALKTILIDPILADQSWSPERADEALIAIATVAVRLAQMLDVPVPPHSQPMALDLVPLPEAAA